MTDSVWSDKVRAMPGHRETQQLAEHKRHRVVTGQARGMGGAESKTKASVEICLSIPGGRVGRRAAVIPEWCPVPLGSVVRGLPGGLGIPMPAVCS